MKRTEPTLSLDDIVSDSSVPSDVNFKSDRFSLLKSGRVRLFDVIDQDKISYPSIDPRDFRNSTSDVQGVRLAVENLCFI